MSAAVKLNPKFTEMLHGLGLDFLIETLGEGQPDVSVRLNARKIPAGASALPFATDGVVPWCDEGFYLPERPLFTADPLLHQGGYYVQEASSMFHYHIIGRLSDMIASETGSTSPLCLLDACAAPGGKTTAAIAAMPEGSLVVANEYVPLRASVLRENLIKWSYSSCVVTRADTASYGRLRECFDVIMTDVPCSGEGMMRKEPEAVAQWSPALVNECVERQWEIVSNLWPALRPGGFLVYSTCTFNRSENELMVERIISDLGAESIEIPVESSWNISPGIDTVASCCRFMPGRTRGEGLFAAVLRKPGALAPSLSASASSAKSRCRTSKGAKTSPIIIEAKSWLSDADAYNVYAEADRITAFPAVYAELLAKIKKHIDVIHEGVPLATVKGRDLIPTQALALSPLLACDAFARVDVDRETALAYLSGIAVELPESTPKSFVLLTYGGLPLGFMKNIGRRANNLYPDAWRIRSRF